MMELYDLVKSVSFFKWTEYVAGKKAIRYKEPLVITAEKNKDNNSYVVNLYYPFLKVTLYFNETRDLIDYEVTDITDLITTLNDIYGELYNLAR